MSAAGEAKARRARRRAIAQAADNSDIRMRTHVAEAA